MSGQFLSAEWRQLVMLNFVIDPVLLEPLVPHGTELDFHEGACYVSLVGFRFLDTKVLGVAIPGHRNFEEVNLRFYVRRKVGGELRRGVVFVREIVPRRWVTWIANWLYHEHYITCPMQSRVVCERESVPAMSLAAGRAVGSSDYGEAGYSAGGADETSPFEMDRRAWEYSWQRNGMTYRLGAECRGELALPAAGSVEEFITEHYWGYVRKRDESTMEYRVEHPQWEVRRADEVVLSQEIARFYGPRFETALSQPAASSLLAEGSSIAVYHGVPVSA